VAGQEVSKTAVMVIDDEGNKQLAGIQGPEYQLIPNSMAKDTVDDIMSRSAYKWQPLKTLWDGKRYVGMYRTEEKITSFSNGQEHGIYLGLMGRNTYDGSGAFGIEVYALNCVCQNQYINRNMFGFFAIRHTPGEAGKFDVQDALVNIEKGAQAVIEIAPKLRLLREEPLTTRHIYDARESTSIPTSKWGTVLEQLSKEEQNRFGLFQALTWTASHELTGLSALSIGDSVGSYFLK
jgi:hypothetical protein